MNEQLTPAQIEVLLRFWYDPSAGQYEWSPHQRRFIDELLKRGILDRSVTGPVCVEEALRPYIEAIRAIPLPRKTWAVQP